MSYWDQIGGEDGEMVSMGKVFKNLDCEGEEYR